MPPRTPLLRPDRYFAERDVDLKALMVAFLVLFSAGPFVVYGVGWTVTDRVDGTVMVDNPNRPPDWVCDEEGDGESAFGDEGCDAPKEVERNIDAILWDAFNQVAGPIIAAFPIILAVLTVLLHAGVKLVGGSRGVFTTAAVATWGMLPGLLVIPVAAVVFWMTLDPVTVSPGDDPAVVFRPIERQIDSLQPFTTAGSVLTAVWGGVIWRYGLAERQALDGAEATLVAGLVALMMVVAGLL